MYDWALDLDITDAEAPAKATRAVGSGPGKPQLQLPLALVSRLRYVSEDDWFAINDIPSATAANALIYKVRQHVKTFGHGLSIKVDSPASTTVADLLTLAADEKKGNIGKTPVVLRFHVKAEARKTGGRPKAS